MGKVKLTLTVDERVVAHAKRLAKLQHTMIEELLAPTGSKLSETLPAIPSALRLRGIAKSSLSQKTDKQIRSGQSVDDYYGSGRRVPVPDGAG